MIIGILDKYRQGNELKQELMRLSESVSKGGRTDNIYVWSNGYLAFCYIPLGIDTMDESPQPFMNKEQTVIVIFEGKIYNVQELKKLLGSDYTLKTSCSGEVLAYLYERYGDNFLDHVNGKFAFALWDTKNKKFLLGRDRLGIESIYYLNDEKRFIFSSSMRALLARGWVDKQLNYQAVLQYLLFCYNPGLETFIRNVHKLPAGHLLTLNESGETIKRYWHLSFAEVEEKSEEQYREEVVDLIKDAIRIRLEPHNPPGILLSGGTDSSTIVSLTSGMVKDPIKTFSFRCEGKSFDESYYARLIADLYNTEHTEIPYVPDSLSLISRAVESMDEPFCDVGIEIATFILGQSTQGKVSYLFSGEGGDELFAGHPVYTADKIAAVIDKIPAGITNPLTWALQLLSDSDQKKNLRVKLKRFAYSFSFPPELLSHRWRIYYTPQELKQLCNDDFIEHCNMNKMLDGILRYNNEADGRDQLSRSLYSDYYTLVDFYLRRLRLLRTFSIENRLPLLDYRLVEYAAKIPSKLKLRGLSDTKYIYKKILEEVLPREILYDRPKLGHSIPMKNWLREDTQVRKWIGDILSDSSFKDRELFRAGFVQRLVDEHIRKTHNHSHRLWGLVVLELWLRTCLDI